MCERVLGGPAGAEVGVSMGVDGYRLSLELPEILSGARGWVQGRRAPSPRLGSQVTVGGHRGAEAVWRVFPWAGPPPRMKALSPARTLAIGGVGTWEAVGDPSRCWGASGSQGSEEACALWRPVWTADTQTAVSPPTVYLPSRDGCPALGAEGSWKPSWGR